LAEPRANDAALLGVFLQPGANALDVATNVKKTLQTLATRFPGVCYSVVYDTTRFVEVSIREVVKTLAEAMLLVFRSCSSSCRAKATL
jgi:multidrug efflux pump